MKKLFAVALAAGLVVVAVAPAEARDGCGRDGYRGPRGHCRSVYGPRPGGVVVAPGIVIGGFYPGRGYWDGHRYYQHRYRYRNDWRYR